MVTVGVAYNRRSCMDTRNDVMKNFQLNCRTINCLTIIGALLLPASQACAQDARFGSAKLSAGMHMIQAEVAADDPLRLAFNALHSNSVTALSVAMLAAAVALFLIARRTK